MSAGAWRAVLLVALALACVPAYAQVQCPSPRAAGDKLRKINEGFTQNVTEPLVRNNVGGLGPVLWAYIAGQARAEGLGGKVDQAGNHTIKPSYNLWNVQHDAKKGCAQSTVVNCKASNQSKPLAGSKKEALASPVATPCWIENGQSMQMVTVCFPSYPSLKDAANEYLAFRPSYTEKLKAMAQSGTPGIDEFLQHLGATGWSSRMRADPDKYKQETRDNIDEALRGIAERRDTTERELAQNQQAIAAWCGERDGADDPARREALKRQQDALLERVALYDQVCLRPAANGSPTPAPTRNNAIDECRKPTAAAPPTPPTVPASTATPDAHATKRRRGVLGEPHYIAPSGAVFSTQRAGEFWLLRSTRDAQIQVRQEPWHGSDSVAAVTAVAMRIGARRVGVYADGVRVDGRPLQWQGAFVQHDLGDGHALGVWGAPAQPEVVAVMWADGSSLRVVHHGSWLDVDYRLMAGVDTAGDAGLIGRVDDEPRHDFVSRSGDALAQPDAAGIDGFVQSWRIRADESLFDYAPGRNAASYELRDFPRTPAAPTAAALAQAREACAAAGVAALLLDACAFDLAVTGERGFLRSHQLGSQALGRMTKPATTPARKTGPTVFFEAQWTPEVEGAEALANGNTRSVAVAAGQHTTYLIDIGKPDVGDLFVLSHQMSCIGDPYDGKSPGYQLFDADGRALSKALAICSDLYSGPIRPGKYYLVLVGAASGEPVTVKFEAFHH
ncbi:hypothetical protein [Lysobacter sp. cf310]|uniref:hypothetical protein n=1 Tax=Lysobacter sp. cf310 TaxID=1761790 RepID=UPI0008F23495|nr:hypothetical protein [Lysobacter sp. cf310]SFK68416.1 hypothetical protein SAMN04487938_1597 [Lysobacter sp. cf310]